MKIRLPSITAPTDSGKIQQLRSYLYQLADQLNWLLGEIDTPAQTAAVQTDVFTLFAQLRPMLIQSAEILDAYREQLKSTFPLRKELEDLAQSHREDIAGLKIPSYQQVKAESATAFSLEGVSEEIFLIAGVQAGQPVLGTVARGSDGVLTASGITLAGEAIPLQTGDRLIILSNHKEE